MRLSIDWGVAIITHPEQLVGIRVLSPTNSSLLSVISQLAKHFVRIAPGPMAFQTFFEADNRTLSFAFLSKNIPKAVV